MNAVGVIAGLVRMAVGTLRFGNIGRMRVLVVGVVTRVASQARMGALGEFGGLIMAAHASLPDRFRAPRLLPAVTNSTDQLWPGTFAIVLRPLHEALELPSIVRHLNPGLIEKYRRQRQSVKPRQ